jgi:hypothetical protein
LRCYPSATAAHIADPLAFALREKGHKLSIQSLTPVPMLKAPCGRGPVPFRTRAFDKADGLIRTVRGLCRATGAVGIRGLGGARAAWGLSWSRSGVPDRAACHSADDRAHGSADDSARNCSSYDSGDGSIAVGQGKLRRCDKDHRCDEKERFLVHEFLLLRLEQYILAIATLPRNTAAR